MVERVDFYVLASAAPEARWDFACRLCEKAYKLGNRVLLLAENPALASIVDERLWAFRPESFVPHILLQEELAGRGEESSLGQLPSAAHPLVVYIAANNQPAGAFDLLINLAPQRPQHLSSIGRIAEVVIQEPQVLLTTRQQFSYYKSLNLPLTTHKL